MQSAAEKKLSEAEIRRRALRVYEGRQDDERQAEIKAAEKARAVELRRSRIHLVLGICMSFALIMGYMVLNTQVTVIGYEINRQMVSNDDLHNENTRLLLQIEQATSPEKVASFAAEHFNMVTPTEESVIYYSKSELAGTETKTVRTGMTIDSKSIGYGNVELINEGESGGLLGMLASLWEQISAGDVVSLGMRD